MASNKLFKQGVAIGDGRFLLKVSQDRLQAWLEMAEVGENKEVPDLFLFKEELVNQGVAHGLLPQAEPMADQEGSFLVARGVPAENGLDAVIEHRITMATKATMPKKKATGRKDEVDHRELHHLINVREGELLAEKRPSTPGRQGRDVLGQAIKARDGKDIPLKGGQRTGLSEDGRRLFAAIDGEYRLTDGRPEVISEHLVRGDVDMKVGNIAFCGVLLTIRGRVLPGFTVRCRGDIDIHGEVNNGLVEAGGGLRVKRSIVGPNARVKCQSDISTATIEGGPIVQSRGGGLTVGSHIVQGLVYVAGDIVAMAGKGVIRGGQYMAGGSLYTRELGSDGEVITEVTVGICPELQLKRIKLQQGNRVWRDRRNKVDRCIDGFRRLKKRRHGRLDAEQAGILAKLQEAGARIDQQLAGLKELEEEIQRELDHYFPQTVCVASCLFAGVTIRIGNGVRFISEHEKGVVVYQDEETRQILSRPLTPEDKPDVAQKGARKERS